jgi:acid phosphatase type 7
MRPEVSDMSRLKWGRLLAALILLAAAPRPGRALSEDSFAIIHGPYLQNPTETSVTVVWFTNKNSVSWVEYGTGESPGTFPKFGSLVKIAKSARDGLVDAFMKRHTVTITGLKPGQQVVYRVVSKEILQFEPYEVVYGPTAVSDLRTFRTLDAKKPSFSFQVFQDLHGDSVQLNGLLQLPGTQNADLLFFNGDTLSSASNEDEIFHGFLDTAVNRFASSTPFIYVRGNHDGRGSFARHLSEYFPPRDGRFYYSFDHGPVHFLVLDSGEDKPDDSPVYAGLVAFDAYRREQAEWLRKEVQTEPFRNAAFRIVIVHIPPIMTGYTPEQLSALWVPIFNDGGIDLVLSGHFHRLYKVLPAAGKNSFPVLGAPPEATIRAEVTSSRIDLNVIDIKGNTIDTLSLPAWKK